MNKPLPDMPAAFYADDSTEIPEPDPKIWTDYYEIHRRDGSLYGEGMAPPWYRILTRIVLGWKWTKV